MLFISCMSSQSAVFSFRRSPKIRELLNYNKTVFTFLPLDMWLTSAKPIVALCLTILTKNPGHFSANLRTQYGSPCSIGSLYCTTTCSLGGLYCGLK